MSLRIFLNNKGEDMSTKKLLKSKKAITPILATLLLIVIAVAAIVVTYAWVMTYMAGTTGQAGTRIKFDSVKINATADYLTIYVRNWGTESVVVDKMYIDGDDFTAHTNLTQPTTIRVNGILLITANLVGVFDFAAGSWYKVKVAGPATFWEESVKGT